jgi:hypothetical protein
MVYFTLLGGRVVGNRGRTSLGEDFVPELGEAPCGGEDDAFSDQDTKHICCDLCTMQSRIKEVVCFVKAAELAWTGARQDVKAGN